VDPLEFCQCELVCGGWKEVWYKALKADRSIKTRFRNANVLFVHRLDLCVKLLAVLHVSST